MGRGFGKSTSISSCLSLIANKLLLVAPFLLFIKARLPLSRHHQVPVRTIAAGFGFLKTKQFWAIETCNIIQGLGYFIPALYLPSKRVYVSFTRASSNANHPSLCQTQQFGFGIISGLFTQYSPGAWCHVSLHAL